MAVCHRIDFGLGESTSLCERRRVGGRSKTVIDSRNSDRRRDFRKPNAIGRRAEGAAAPRRTPEQTGLRRFRVHRCRLGQRNIARCGPAIVRRCSRHWKKPPSPLCWPLEGSQLFADSRLTLSSGECLRDFFPECEIHRCAAESVTSVLGMVCWRRNTKVLHW